MKYFLKHKGWIKVGIMMMAIIFLFQGATFAENTDDMNLLGEAVHFIVSFASWGWVILAVLAGKLMTNDFVYGSFMHLDIYLRKLWNVMKNFANFAIGFAFLVAILRSIFVTKKNGKNIVVKFLLAGVLVQASWFLIGAVMDLSTIATTAISSFPAQFMAGDNAFLGNMKDKYANLYGKKLIFNGENSKKPTLQVVSTKKAEDITDDDVKQITDLILPTYKTVSGPLLFLGFSIFDFSSFPDPKTLEGQTDTDFGGLLIYLGINGLIVILFTVALLLLFIINLIRIAMLWVMIPLSPFIVLASLFKDTLKLDKMPKWFNIQTVVTLLFKPVIFVAYLSLVFIFTVGVFSVLNPKDETSVEFEDQGVTVSSTKDSSSFQVEGLVDITLKGAKNTISGIIVYLFALFLMRYLIKIAAKTGTGIKSLDDSMNKITSGVENMAGQVGVIPIPTGNGTTMVGTKALSQGWDQFANGPVSISNTVQEQQTKFNAMFGLGGKSWDDRYDTQLQQTITAKNYGQFWDVTRAVAGEVQGGLSLSDGQWSKHFESWLESLPINGVDVPVGGGKAQKWKRKDSAVSLDTYFKDPAALANLHEQIDGLPGNKSKGIDVKFGRYWSKE